MRTRVAVGGSSEPATTIRRHDLEVTARRLTGSANGRARVVCDVMEGIKGVQVLARSLSRSQLSADLSDSRECVSRGTRSTDSIRA
jgi:hypothetical protein